VGEKFYYSNPQRLDSVCVNLGKRSSEDSENTDESLQYQMILRTDGDLLKESYPTLSHTVPPKRCTVESKVKTFKTLVHRWSVVCALSVDYLYFAVVVYVSAM